MKILQVITSLRIGGAEKLVADMVPLLQAKGHVVEIFVFDGITTPFLQQLEDNDVCVIRYNYGASMYDPKNILKLIRLIPQYDIVHTHNTSCQYYVAIARNLCKCNHVRFVTTEHSTTNRRRDMFMFKYLDKWMYRQYDSIISISDKATVYLQNFIGTEFNIKTIYNGINLHRFINAGPLEQDLILKKNAGDFIISMIAGFREEKDQDTLIKALKYLPEKCKLWLIGDGVRKEICVNLVQKMALVNRVVFTGIRTDIPNILKTSDVIVMSSHWEGFGLAAIEGMAAGKPVIASNVDGLAQVSGKAGVLFEPSNEIDLASAIKKIMTDKTFYMKTANECLKRALDFDINKTVYEYMDLYKGLHD